MHSSECRTVSSLYLVLSKKSQLVADGSQLCKVYVVASLKPEVYRKWYHKTQVGHCFLSDSQSHFLPFLGFPQRLAVRFALQSKTMHSVSTVLQR